MKSLDILAGVIPQLANGILNGRIKVSQENIMELARSPVSVIKNVGEKLLDNGSLRYTDTRFAYSSLHRKHDSILPEHESGRKRAQTHLPTVTVKTTPPYDPDLAVSTLSLTVPSWTDSLHRMRSEAHLSEVSKDAKLKLRTELVELKELIQSVIASIEEALGK